MYDAHKFTTTEIATSCAVTRSRRSSVSNVTAVSPSTQRPWSTTRSAARTFPATRMGAATVSPGPPSRSASV